jgi:hypothetical protein
LAVSRNKSKEALKFNFLFYLRDMFRLIFIFAFLSAHVFAQNKDTLRVSHNFGAGVQLLSDTKTEAPHAGGEIHYKSPFPYIFYRLNLLHGKGNLICATLSGYYRSATGSSYSGGLGSGDTYTGNFNLFRLEGGFSYLWSLGRNKPLWLGIGVNFGAITSANGNIEKRSWSMSTSNINKTDAPVLSVLNKTVFGFNIEISRKIRLPKNAIICGLKGMIQSADGFIPNRILSAALFVSYNFFERVTIIKKIPESN